jgi:cytochrome P450 monooxygenase
MTQTEDWTLLASDEPFDRRLCPHLRKPNDGPAVRQITTPAGDRAWLVGRYAEIRALLRDHRVGRSHADAANKPLYEGNPIYDHATSEDHDQADRLHENLRLVLTPHFKARHMLDLRPRVAALVSDAITRFATLTPPVDLHTRLAEPLALVVLCELLGIPAGEREHCATLITEMGVSGGAGERTGQLAFQDYLHDLAARKRTQPPQDDLISRLVAGGEVSDEQVGELCMLTLFAGVSSTVSQFKYGFLLLAEDDEQREMLIRDPSMVPRAVEETLRIAGTAGLPRYAREDFEFAGADIKEGDLVLLDLARANLDANAFDEPEKFDVTRSPNRHLTFAHSTWTCVGAPLARIVLQELFTAVLTRLPTIRPTVPAAEAGTSDASLSGGLAKELLVTW